MTALLVVLGLLAAGLGSLLLSEATMGVGIIGLACFVGILGRISQASGQHAEITRLLLKE